MFTFLTSCLGMKIKVRHRQTAASNHLTSLWVVQGFFAFEAPMIFRTIFAVITTFMSSKLKSRFHVAGSDYSLLKDAMKVPSSSPRLPCVFR